MSNQVEPARSEAGFFGRLSSADHVNSPAGLTGRVFAGVGWLLGQNAGARIISLASQIVLARILLPSDFAALALAGTVTSLFEALISFGVDDVLVQRQRTMRYWAKPAFVTSLGLSIASMLLVIACMPVAVHLYEAPVLYSILPIMALGMPLSALSTVPAAALRAALNFRFLATYSAIELAVGQVAVIALALHGLGVISFVLPGPVLAVVRAAFFWFVAKPQLGRLRFRQLRMMGKASSAVFGSRVIAALVSQGDYFVLGLFASKPEVGAYFFAFRLAVQPLRVLAGSLISVLVPALATLRNEPLRQGEVAVSACRVLAFITMPYGFMQAAVARPLFGLLFGSKWDDAIVPAEILSVGLAFDAVAWIALALLSARGEFRRSFVYHCILGPAFFLLVAVGAHFGAATAIGAPTGVAIAASLFYVIVSPCFSFAAFSRTGASLRSIAMIYVNSTTVSTIAIGVAVALVHLVPTGPIAQIAIIVTFGGGLYIVLLRFVSPWTFNYVKDRLRDVIRAKRSDIERNYSTSVERIDTGVTCMTDTQRPIDIANPHAREEYVSRSPAQKSSYVNDFISVVIPVRNGERFIGRTLQSVLNQSYRNFEVIIVDDGSTDSSIAIAKQVAANDPRVRYHSGPRAGVAAARNCGIAQARGEFIAPVDADDLWHKDKLLLQLHALRQAGARTGLAYCWSVYIDEADNTLSGKRRRPPRFEGDVLPALFEHNILGNASTPLIRHACLDLVGGYDPGLYLDGAQGAEDWKLYLALAETCEFALVPRYLVGYRKPQDSMSANFVTMQRSMDLVRQWAQKRWPLLAEKHGKQERYLTYLYLAYTAVESNSFGHALLFFAGAIRAQPAQLVGLRTHIFMVRVLVKVVGVRGLSRKIWTPTTFWEFVEQIDNG